NTLAPIIVSATLGLASAIGLEAYFNIRLRWDTRRTPLEITLTPTASQFVLLGLTSIDEGTSAFRSQPIRGAHDMRLVYSGDVKIYENQLPAPHALLVTLADCSTLNGELPTGAQTTEQQAGTVRTVANSAEHLTLEVWADVPAWLILRDACYPGWVARIDGAEVPITCADTLFRAVQVPPGTHTIVFSYEPQSLQAGMGLSGAGLAIWLLLLGYPTLFGVGQRHPAGHRRRS
ncbi:MAG: YfhO family protein, partial [Chloroflexi bacterium]|nr:YfhO family protein [Chloroflexota bacterium]